MSTFLRALQCSIVPSSMKKKPSTTFQQNWSSWTKINQCCSIYNSPINPLLNNSVRYKIGEAFVHIPHSGAIKLLEKNQAIVGAKVTKIAAEADECETEMKQLKVLLYAKFGKAINLDE